MTCNPEIHLLDDDPAIRESLQLLLTMEGYAVHSHASARTILETIQDSDRGCIVTDLHMPKVSGLDLLAALKERRVSLPVIVITGRSDRWLAAEAMREGAFDFSKSRSTSTRYLFPFARRFQDAVVSSLSPPHRTRAPLLMSDKN